MSRTGQAWGMGGMELSNIYGGLELQDIVIALRFLGLIHRQKGGDGIIGQ